MYVLRSHPVRVRGLKLKGDTKTISDAVSHPVRVRGLKRLQTLCDNAVGMSHPVRVRGLKHRYKWWFSVVPGRTPCGCVD